MSLFCGRRGFLWLRSAEPACSLCRTSLSSSWGVRVVLVIDRSQLGAHVDYIWLVKRRTDIAFMLWGACGSQLRWNVSLKCRNEFAMISEANVRLTARYAYIVEVSRRGSPNSVYVARLYLS